MRNMTSRATTLSGALLVIPLTIVTVAQPALGIGVVIAVIAIVIFIRAPWVFVPVTVLLAYTAFPAAIPRSVGVGGLSAYLYEITLVASLVFALARRPPRRRTDALGAIVLLVTAISALLGYVAGNPLNPAMNDARGLVIVGLSIIIAGRVFGHPEAAKTVRVFKWVLWFSAAMVTAGQFGLPLHGASEDAGLSFAGGGDRALSGAERFLTSATHASLATVCIAIALIITNRARLRTVAPWLVPALVVVFFSFSRNSILAIAVAVVFALVSSQQFRSFVTAGATFVGGGLIIWAVYALATASSADGPLGWLAVQINAYANRVVEGIDPSVISVDTSAQYRNKESELLVASWQQAPIFGHGMGYAYRIPVGAPDSFTATSGIYYAHNFYLWLAVKAGLIGVAIIVTVFVIPLLRRMGEAPSAVAGSAAALAGLLVGSWVAPFPLGFESASSMLMGALLGVTAAWRRGEASPAAASTKRLRTNTQSRFVR